MSLSSDALKFLNSAFPVGAAPVQQSANIPAAGPNALPFVASYPPPAQMPLASNSGIPSAAAASAFAPMASPPPQPLAQPLAFNAIPIVVNGQQIKIPNPGMGFGNGASAAPVVIQLVLIPPPSAAAAAPNPQPMFNMPPEQGMAMAAPMAPAPSGGGGGGGGGSWDQAASFDLVSYNSFFRLRDGLNYSISQRSPVKRSIRHQFNKLVDSYLDFNRIQQQAGRSNTLEHQSAVKEMVDIMESFEDTFERFGWFDPANAAPLAQENPYEPTEEDLKEWDAACVAAAANDPETFYSSAAQSYRTAGEMGFDNLQKALSLINQAIARKSDLRFFSLRAKIYHQLSKLSGPAQRDYYNDKARADFKKIELSLDESDLYTYIWALINKLGNGTVPDSDKPQMIEELNTFIIVFEAGQNEHVASGRRKKEDVDKNIEKMKKNRDSFAVRKRAAAPHSQAMSGMGSGQNRAMAAPMPVSFGGGGGGGGGWNPAYSASATAVEMESKQVMSADAARGEELFLAAEPNYQRALYEYEHPDVIEWLNTAFNDINQAIALGGSDVKFFRLRTRICWRLNHAERSDRLKIPTRLERFFISLEDFRKIPERDMEDEGVWTWIHIQKYHLEAPFNFEQKSLLLSILTTGVKSYKRKFNECRNKLSRKRRKEVNEEINSIRNKIDEFKKTLDQDKAEAAACVNEQPASGANNSRAAAAAAAAPPRPAASASAQPYPVAAAAAAAAPAESSVPVKMEIDSGNGSAPKDGPSASMKSGAGQTVKMDLV